MLGQEVDSLTNETLTEDWQVFYFEEQSSAEWEDYFARLSCYPLRPIRDETQQFGLIAAL
jgi:hypothetical protein